MSYNKIDDKNGKLTEYNLTGKGVASALGVHFNTVNKWAKYGCPCIHTSRDTKGKAARRRFNLEEVLEWLKSRSSAQDKTGK